MFDYLSDNKQNDSPVIYKRDNGQEHFTKSSMDA